MQELHQLSEPPVQRGHRHAASTRRAWAPASPRYAKRKTAAATAQVERPRSRCQEWGVSICVQNVAFSAHGLKIDGIGGVDLDLVAQSVDLHVDCALAARGVVAGKLVAGDGQTRALRKQAIPLWRGKPSS
jgi:hypothetical protein